MSAMLPITATASTVQGSAVGPASYVVNAADLTTVSSTNHLVTYADDTYLIIPASNIGTRADELDHIERWSAVNNLKLNRRKSTEIEIHRFPTETLSSSTVTSDRRLPGVIMFGSRVGFSWSSDRMALFPVTSNPSWRQANILDNFEWPYLRNGSFDPLI